MASRVAVDAALVTVGNKSSPDKRIVRAAGQVIPRIAQPRWFRSSTREGGSHALPILSGHGQFVGRHMPFMRLAIQFDRETWLVNRPSCDAAEDSVPGGLGRDR